MDKKIIEDKIEKENILDLESTEITDKELHTKKPDKELKVETGELQEPDSDESGSDSSESDIMKSVEDEIIKKEPLVDVDKKIKFDERKLTKDTMFINNMEKMLSEKYGYTSETNKSDSTESNVNNVTNSDIRRLKNKKIEFELFQSKNELGILNELRQVNSYNESNVTNFYRKSLELQYKTFYIQRDFLKLFKIYQIDTRNQLASIVKNSSLSNSMKLAEDGAPEGGSNLSFVGDLIKYDLSRKISKLALKEIQDSEFFKRKKQELIASINNSELSQNELVQGLVNDYLIDNRNISALRSSEENGVVGNIKFEDSVVKVIPGLLSKILQQVTNIYRKTDDVEELEYNYERDTFSTKSEMMEFMDSKFKKEINRNIGNIDEQLEKIVSLGGNNINNVDKDNIKKAIYKQILNDYNNGVMNTISDRGKSLDRLKSDGFDENFINNTYVPFLDKINNDKNNKEIKKSLENVKIYSTIDPNIIASMMGTLSGSDYMNKNNISLYKDDGLLVDQNSINKYKYESYINKPVDEYQYDSSNKNPIDSSLNLINSSIKQGVGDTLTNGINSIKNIDKESITNGLNILNKNVPNVDQLKNSVTDILNNEKRINSSLGDSINKLNNTISNIDLSKENITNTLLEKSINGLDTVSNLSTNNVKDTFGLIQNIAKDKTENYINKDFNNISTENLKTNTLNKLSDVFSNRVNIPESINLKNNNILNSIKNIDRESISSNLYGILNNANNYNIPNTIGNSKLEDSVVNIIPDYLSKILGKVSTIVKTIVQNDIDGGYSYTNTSYINPDIEKYTSGVKYTVGNTSTVPNNVNINTKNNIRKGKDPNTKILEDIRDTLKESNAPQQEARSGNWKDRLAAFADKAKSEVNNIRNKNDNNNKDNGSSFDLLGMLGGLMGKGGLLTGILGGLGVGGGALAAAKTVGSIGKGALSLFKGPAKYLFDVGKKTISTFGSIGKGIVNVATGGPIKALTQKILPIANSLKSQIVKKLGKVAGGKLVGTLTAKIAARAVPIAGAALLAYDAYNIYRDVQEGMELKSAISKNLIGFDIFGDDVPVDENGNPIKPDENLEKEDVTKSVENENEKIGTYAKRAQDEYNSLKADLNSYRVGFISKSKLPKSKVTRDKIDKEIESLNKLKEWNKIADVEYQECMKTYDQCYKLVEELELIESTGGLTKEEKKKNFDELETKPVEHFNKEAVKDKFDEYQKEKNKGVKLQSATEDISGINNVTKTNNNYNSSFTNTANNKDYNGTSDVKNVLSNANVPSATTASMTTVSKPVNNVTTKKPSTVKLSADKQEIVKIIDDVGKQIGTDPEIMKAIAASESGFNPKAKANTSSASGLFQITDDTWKGLVQQHGAKYGITNNDDHFDPVKNSILGGMYIKTNINALSKVKPDANATDAYMGHFLGTGGARTFLRNMTADPDKKFSDTFPENVIKANKYIAYKNADPSQPRTLKEVYELMGSKIQKNAMHYGFNVTDEMVGLGSSNKSNSPLVQAQTTSVTPPPITNENISKVEPKSDSKTGQSSSGAEETTAVSNANAISDISTSVSPTKTSVSTSAKSSSPMMSASEDIANSKSSISTTNYNNPITNNISTRTISNNYNSPAVSEPKYDYSYIKPVQNEGMFKPSFDASVLPSIDKTLIETLNVNKNMDNTLTKILEANIKLIEEVKNIHIEQSTPQINQPQPMYTQNTVNNKYNQSANTFASSDLPIPTMNISRLSS